MTDEESGNDADLAEAGIDNVDDAPKWEQERLSKMSAQKREALGKAAALERQNAILEGRLEALENQQNQAPAPRAPEPKGLDRFTSVDELKQVAKRLYEYQNLASDPDAAPEARQAARAELAKIDDVPGTLADIQVRMADIVSERRMSEYDSRLQSQNAASAGQNALVNKLFLEFGKDALSKGSPLNKGAAALIQDWINDGEVTAANAGDQFVVTRAFREASEKLNPNRGGRGRDDPRHSAIEGGGSGRGSASQDLIASLKAKGAQGDYKSRKKASSLEIGNFLTGLRNNGHIA